MEPARAVAAAAVGGVAAEVGAVVAAVLAEALPAPDALVGPVGAVADAVAEVADVDAILLPLGIALHGGILASAIFRHFRAVIFVFKKLKGVQECIHFPQTSEMHSLVEKLSNAFHFKSGKFGMIKECI